MSLRPLFTLDCRPHELFLVIVLTTSINKGQSHCQSTSQKNKFLPFCGYFTGNGAFPPIIFIGNQFQQKICQFKGVPSTKKYCIHVESPGIELNIKNFFIYLQWHGCKSLSKSITLTVVFTFAHRLKGCRF